MALPCRLDCSPNLLIFISFFCLADSLLVTTQSPPVTATKKEMAKNTSQLLNQLLADYDKRLRPGFGGAPTFVDVNLNIRSMGPISERDMAYQMDCYFRQSWVDKRLEFDSGPMKTLPVSVNILDRIWKPDTHFFNGRKSYLHTVTTPNKLLRINKNGRILYSMRLTIKASCPMHLETFPMDTQTCPLKFGSHGYGVEDVLYIWTNGSDKSIKIASDMTLSQFDLIGFPAGNETITNPGGEEHSILFATFVMRRHMGYFMINVYVPCSLLVILSWVAFWINREATADRIALGVMTVLTMTFLSIDNRRDLPKVSYSTALDYFVGVCFAFVLATILQFAGVHFFTKHGSGEVFFDAQLQCSSDEEELEESQTDAVFCTRRNRKQGQCPEKMNGAYSGATTNDTRGPTSSRYRDEIEARMRRGAPLMKDSCWDKVWNCLKGSAHYRTMKMLSTPEGINSVSKIDKLARVLFPVAFTGFHAFYWPFYLDSDGLSAILSGK